MTSALRGALHFRLVCWLGLLALAACGPTGSGDDDDTGGQHDGGSWNVQMDGPHNWTGDGPGPGPDFTPDAGPCAAETTKAERLPLDMYILLDKSGSMDDPVSGGTKWTAVTSALNTFLTQPDAAGMSVGIQYFPLPDVGNYCGAYGGSCMSDSDCGPCGPCVMDYSGMVCAATSSGDSCNAADYAKAAVEIAELPGVASAISSSISGQSPLGATPTAAALQGGINHAQAWGSSHPDHVTIVVFATDGEPTECDVTLGNIYAIASAGANGTPKVLTFVIGVGTSTSALNGIAQAGGTTQAFLVDTGANTTQQFLEALNAIRGAALGCTYTIPTPESGTPDYKKVNVQYTPGGGGQPQIFPQVPSATDCPASGNAWYYDDPIHPTQIILCDATCTTVTADATGQIDILLGCTTVID